MCCLALVQLHPFIIKIQSSSTFYLIVLFKNTLCIKKKKKHTDQQLKEEPGIFVCILSADARTDDHLEGQLLMKLLQEAQYTNYSEKQPLFGR